MGEEELADLGPEWVRPATLLALQARRAAPRRAARLPQPLRVPRLPGLSRALRAWIQRPSAATELARCAAAGLTARCVPPLNRPRPQEDVLGVADDCGDAVRRHPAGRRLCRTLQALLGLSTQMQDSMGAERPHHHKQSVAAAIARLGAVAAGRRG